MRASLVAPSRTVLGGLGGTRPGAIVPVTLAIAAIVASFVALVDRLESPAQCRSCAQLKAERGN